jgi:hypothetical protein
VCFAGYYPELNFSATAELFLQRAAGAAEEIVNGRTFEITGRGVSDPGGDVYGATCYPSIFHSRGSGRQQ